MKKQTGFSEKILRSRKLKVTSTRTKLLQEINDYEAAMPFSMIQQKFSDTDRVTLYRTIEVLVSKGLIHKAFTNNKETYYALCGEHCTDTFHSHNHVHFKCTVCQTVTCQHLPNEIQISLPGFSIEKVNVNLIGVCQTCNQS